jgi:hypothetical protein
MEYHLAIKKNEIMLFAGRCMELEIIMWKEISQNKKETLHVLSLVQELVLKKMND